MSRKIVGVTVGTSLNPKKVKERLRLVTSVNGEKADETGNVELPIPDGTVQSVNGVKPDSQGNVEIEIPEPSKPVDLTGYATEEFVRDGFQPKGNYLTEVPSGYAKTSDIPIKTSQLTNDSGFLTEVPEGYATEDFVKNKIADAALSGGDVDLNGYAQKSEIPTKVSQLTNDKGYITGYTETDPTVPTWAKQAQKPSYTASEVGALPNTTKIPSKTSDLTNDSGFITGYTETDPTVPAWAKNASKPSYSKSEVGLGNVPNVSTNDQTPTFTAASTLATLTSGEKLSVAFGKMAKAISDFISHIGNKSNPHGVTKSNVGLGNVDNVKQYSASNPPPYPVTSVNGKTGEVTLDASAVGARPDTWTPSASDIEGYDDWFGPGTKIPDGADINTYTTNGKYYCGSEASAKTLVNSPTTSNFCLYVFDRTSKGTVTHLAISLPGRMYLRSKSSSSWRDWDQFLRKSAIVNDFATTEDGYVADARTVKTLNDRWGKFRTYSGQANPSTFDITSTWSCNQLFYMDSAGNVGLIAMNNMASIYTPIVNATGVVTVTDNAKYNITVTVPTNYSNILLLCAQELSEITWYTG